MKLISVKETMSWFPKFPLLKMI